jgi:hypothetical protein
MISNVVDPEFVVSQLHEDLYSITMVSKIDDECIVIATASTQELAQCVADGWDNWYKKFKEIVDLTNVIIKENSDQGNN